MRIDRRVPARIPEDPDTLHLLGLIASETGDQNLAAALIVRAIRARGPEPAFCANLGLVLHRDGRIQEAVACYRQALQGNPHDTHARFHLACALRDWGHMEEAAEGYRDVLARDPAMAEAHYELGNAMHRLGCAQEAERSYRDALALRPSYAEAWYNLGVTLTGRKQPEEAAACYREAIRLHPGYAEAHNNLGNLLHGFGQLEDALASYRRAVEARPDYIDARYNVSRTLQDLDRLDEAERGYCDVIARSPAFASAHNNLGNTLLALGRTQQAAECYSRAAALSPEFARAHWNLGLLNLLLGDFAAGWEGYEWRFRHEPWRLRPFSQPAWDGAPLEGRKILLHAEQGHGDTLQFVRYAPLVKARGGFVIIECHTALVRLLRGVAGADEVVARGTALPEFDVHAPLLSLPRLFGTAVSTIPAAVPYLTAAAELAGRWRGLRGDSAGASYRVGLTWAGSPGHRNDRNRSLSCGELSLLKGIPDVAFFSLQHGAAPEELALLARELRLAPFGAEFSDFADTAAAIADLDLVISVDTAVAHLAGALGKPVWVLLPFAPDWRWMLDREDSPWYPTMRLFRQPRRGDWRGALERMRAELSRMAANA